MKILAYFEITCARSMKYTRVRADDDFVNCKLYGPADDSEVREFTRLEKPVFLVSRYSCVSPFYKILPFDVGHNYKEKSPGLCHDVAIDSIMKTTKDVKKTLC